MKNHLRVAFLSALAAPCCVRSWPKMGSTEICSQCELMMVDGCKSWHNFSCRMYDPSFKPRLSFPPLSAKDFKWAIKLPLVWSLKYDKPLL